MKKIEPKKIIVYWVKTAKHDYEAMNDFFKIKRYTETLFFGHIVLEKTLKALVVYKTKNHAPFTHDLVKLQEIAGLGLSKNEIDFLDEMNEYNVRTRYPDYKLKIYKLCTQKFTKERLNKIQTLFRKLCEQVK